MVIHQYDVTWSLNRPHLSIGDEVTLLTYAEARLQAFDRLLVCLPLGKARISLTRR